MSDYSMSDYPMSEVDAIDSRDVEAEKSFYDHDKYEGDDFQHNGGQGAYDAPCKNGCEACGGDGDEGTANVKRTTVGELKMLLAQVPDDLVIITELWDDDEDPRIGETPMFAVTGMAVRPGGDGSRDFAVLYHQEVAEPYSEG